MNNTFFFIFSLQFIKIHFLQRFRIKAFLDNCTDKFVAVYQDNGEALGRFNIFCCNYSNTTSIISTAEFAYPSEIYEILVGSFVVVLIADFFFYMVCQTVIVFVFFLLAKVQSGFHKIFIIPLVYSASFQMQIYSDVISPYKNTANH